MKSPLFALWLALPAAGCSQDNSQAQPAAEAKPARDSLVAMARLEPRGRVVKVGAPDGVVARVLVREGERVKAGQPLAFLDTHATRLAERDQARLKLERAQALPLEIEAREAELKAAEAASLFRNAVAERYQGLFSQGLVPEGDAREAEMRATQARADLARARAALESARRSAQLGPQEAQADLRRAEAYLEQAVVRAPADGQVLRVIARSGERSGTQGVLQLGDTAEMYAVAEVHANDVRLVRVGQRASFTSPALPAPVDGEVASVGALIFKNEVFGESPTAPENQRIVQVWIRLAQAEAAARLTNLEGQARIMLGDAPRP